MLPIESLLEDIEALGHDPAHAKTRELLSAVLDLHGRGLARAMDIARAQGDAGLALVDALVEDELVASLLLLHALHPVGLEARVRKVLATEGASLRAQGGLVELVSVEAGVVHLRVRRGKGTEAALRARIDELLCGSAPDAAGITIAWDTDGAADAFVPLTQLRVKAPKAPRSDTEGDSCELCGLALSTRHEHLVDKDSRDLRCTCTACALLFSDSHPDAPRKWKRVPHRSEGLSGFRMTDAQWEALGIPIGMAFFYESSAAREVIALYPGPGGAVESRLPAGAWSALVADNPALRDLAADVEALLVNRVHGERAVYRVSIDQCYELVGRLRKHWRGFTGGPELWSDVGAFFGALAEETGAARA